MSRPAAPPALLAVAHGSRDPRAARVLGALLARIRADRPDTPAALGFLGHAAPDVPAALHQLVDTGVRRVVVVPLLLTAAYHARQDLPGVLDRFGRDRSDVRLGCATVLGPHPLLLGLLRRRLVEAGAPAGSALVLGAVGTSDPVANRELAGVARRLGADIGFAGGPPWIGDVVGAARARGGPVAVATYALAPGLLPDRLAAAGADVTSAPFGAAAEVATVVWERYDAALAGPVRTASTPPTGQAPAAQLVDPDRREGARCAGRAPAGYGSPSTTTQF